MWAKNNADKKEMSIAQSVTEIVMSTTNYYLQLMIVGGTPFSVYGNDFVGIKKNMLEKAE